MATGSSYTSPYGLTPGSAPRVLREPPTLAHDLARSHGGGTGHTRDWTPARRPGARSPVHDVPGRSPVRDVPGGPPVDGSDDARPVDPHREREGAPMRGMPARGVLQGTQPLGRAR